MNVRPAVHADIPELVRLRAILADRMAQDSAVPEAGHSMSAAAAGVRPVDALAGGRAGSASAGDPGLGGAGHAGGAADAAEEDWREAYARGLRDRLGDPDVAVFVIDAPGGDGLAACGMGFIFERFPGPRLPDGRFGYILGMTTDSRYRRRGYGAAIMDALMSWYKANGVRRVDLHATSDGEPLYARYGFTTRYPGMSWSGH